MPAKLVAPGFYIVTLGIVNVYLLETEDGLILFDAGMPGKMDTVLEAIRQIGKQPSDLKHILLTHGHPDHFGSLAALQQATGARTYVHALDAGWVRRGGDFNPREGDRNFIFSPGIAGWMARLFIRPYIGMEPSVVDQEIDESSKLPGGVRAIFTPGHSAGHLCYVLEKHGGVVIAGDICANLPYLNWSLGYEDFEAGKRSLRKICQLDFQAIVFGHGGPIRQNAADRFRKRWAKI